MIIRKRYPREHWKVPWDELVKYEYETHYPFKVEGLSMKYLGIRDLLVVIKKILDREGSPNGSVYSLSLNNEVCDEIKSNLKKLKKGEISISLEELLRKLSEREYRKGGKNYKMFNFQDPKPIHRKCGQFLPERIQRRCSACDALSMEQIVQSGEIYSGIKPRFKESLKCNQCGKIIELKHLNCPFCNPDDLPSYKLPEDRRNSAYIFPDQLDWSPPIIEFYPAFYNTILRGIEYEQEIYYQLLNFIPETQIKLSTRIKTTANNGWGVEIDILFVDKRQGKLLENYDWTLHALEIKNQKDEIEEHQIQEFYDEVSPITKNLMFVSKSSYTEEARLLCYKLDIERVFSITNKFR